MPLREDSADSALRTEGGKRQDAVLRRTFVASLFAAPALLQTMFANGEEQGEIAQEEILPSALKNLPPSDPVRLAWKSAQNDLEAVEIANAAQRNEVDGFAPQEWEPIKQGIALLRTRNELPQPDEAGRICFMVEDDRKHLWTELSAHEPRNEKQMIDVALKISSKRIIYCTCDGMNNRVSEEAGEITRMESLGIIAFEIIDAHGTVIGEGQTKENGVGTVHIPHRASRPCKIRFKNVEAGAEEKKQRKAGGAPAIGGYEVSIG